MELMIYIFVHDLLLEGPFAHAHSLSDVLVECHDPPFELHEKSRDVTHPVLELNGSRVGRLNCVLEHLSRQGLRGVVVHDWLCYFCEREQFFENDAPLGDRLELLVGFGQRLRIQRLELAVTLTLRAQFSHELLLGFKGLVQCLKTVSELLYLVHHASPRFSRRLFRGKPGLLADATAGRLRATPAWGRESSHLSIYRLRLTPLAVILL